jgi:predicted ATPase
MAEDPSKKEETQRIVPFIGRESVLDEMSKAMEEVERKQGSCFLISGEAGVGKTSLSSKVQELARAKKWTVMASECMFAEGGSPYQPLLQAMASAQTKANARTPTGSRTYLTLGLLGIDGKGLVNLDQKMRTTDELKVERESMFETISDFLADVSTRSPVLLVLDDMHRADNSTCQMLYYLVRSMADQRMLIMGTYRPEEIEASKTIHPMLDLRTRLQREGLVTLRELKRFTEEETARFLGALVGYELPARLVKKIHNDTNGNPYFITEFIGTLKGTGMFRHKEDAEEAVPDIEDEDIKIPSSVSAFIIDKIERLSPDELKLLQFGSIIGQEFPYEVIIDVSGISEEEAVQHIEVLMAQKLITEVVTGDRISYRFTHNLIKEVVYSHLSRSKRRLMHKMVGYSIEKVEAGKADQMVYQLAYHFAQGADAPKALRYNMLAGKKAAGSFALDEAKHYYEEALDMLSKQEETEVTLAMEIDLLNKLGLIASIQGETTKAKNYHQEALELTKEGTKEWAAAIRRLAEAEILQDHWKSAEENLRRAIQVSEGLNDQLGLSESYYDLEHIAFKTGKPNEVVQFADKAVEYAKKAKDERLVGKSLIDKANATAELMQDYQKAIPIYDEAMKHFDQVKDLDQIARTYSNMGDVHEKLGEYKKAIDYLERCLNICNKTGDVDQKAYANANMGLVYLDMDDRKMATKYFNEALRLWNKVENKHLSAMTHHNLAIIARRDGDFDRAEQELQTAFTVIENVEFKLGLAYLNLEYGIIWRERGEKQKARWYMKKALGMVEEIGSEGRIREFKKELSTLDQ